jgi:O-antigen/teichoic acid export membrane protein
LRVLWKETAEAFTANNISLINYIYHNTCKILTICGAIIAGFLIPWSKEITLIFLGESYSSAWVVLAIMFVYPIHQALGQINITMYLAQAQTRVYSIISIIFMFVSIPISIIVQMPASGYILPGLGMGALGMASKAVILNIVVVNILSWFLARQNGWKFQYLYQLVIVIPLIIFGYLSKYLVIHLFAVDVFNLTNFLVFGSASFFVFFILSLLYAFCVPSYFCLDLINKGKLCRIINPW